MPKWLRRLLRRSTLKTHLVIALAAGFLVRALSAWFVYGPQALDDYKHGVWPAYQLAMGLPVDLPDYRSYLLVALLSVFVKTAELFDLTSALAQVRAMYLGLGLISLSAIYGTYLFALSRDKSRHQSKIFGPAALYLVALFPLMPFVSTRAFGEAVAMSVTAMAFGLLEYTRVREPKAVLNWTAGFCLLGLATLFRFHVGLMYVVYGVILVFLRQWRGLTGWAVAGVVTIVLQSAVDVLSGKGPMATLYIYLRENEGGAVKYGVSPWYNPLLFLMAISLVPFSLPLLRSAKSLWHQQKFILIPWLIFVAAHCLTPHKEERFLYPILVLHLWAIALLWTASSFNRWARSCYTWVLIVLSALLLPVTTLVNTQEGEIEPPAFLESTYGSVLYLDDESLFGKSRFQFYFLRPPSLLQKISADEMNLKKVDEALRSYPSLRAIAFLTSKPENELQLRSIAGLSTMDGRCNELREAGSLVDRLIYHLNPKHNQRRRPTWYLVCERLSENG